MAHLLHLDDSEIASKAFRGILTRAGHRVVTVGTTVEAWEKLRELVKFDLLVLELKLKGENGLSFLARLRADPFLQHLPAVVYSGINDPLVVKKALAFKVQNYLIKPYSDSSIYNEIQKSLTNPWRNLLFEEEKSFCTLMGLTPALLRTMREKLIDSTRYFAHLLPGAEDAERQPVIVKTLDDLAAEAEAAGTWGLVEVLGTIKSRIEAKLWKELPPFSADLEYSANLSYCQLHPDYLHTGFLSDQERHQQQEAKERDHWLNADVLAHGPLVQRDSMLDGVSNLKGCPVVDSVAASFMMFADGQVSNLSRIADVVSKDPALSAQLLIEINKIERASMNTVEDPRLAVSLLGEARLNSISRRLVTVEERHLSVPPFTWPHYWMYLLGVARIAQYTCLALEYKDLAPTAYTAGLLHDLGRLLIMQAHPFGFQAMLLHARQKGIPLEDAERRYVDISARELAVSFAENQGLPEVYRHVIQGIDHPAEAKADGELVAAVSLARMLCIHNHVGNCGSTGHASCPPIEQTEAWQVLGQRVFPSFNLHQFEAHVHAYSRELRIELLGRIKE
jgi:CheY-like chemotaxis protein/HD-like signal output (HDOD) protein